MRESLNPKSMLPLYHQLFELLHDKIVTGTWKPGDLVPPESELTSQYRVSRITVRKVLDLLVKEGYVVRERGRGTFVSSPRLEHVLTRIVSFVEDMQQRGLTPGTKVLFSGVVPAPATIATELSVPEGEELVRIDRLRLADGEPMCVEQSYHVHRLMPGILSHDYAIETMREVLKREYGIRLARARQRIHAILAPPDVARALAVKTNAALLYIERVSYSQHEVPVEFLRMFYRADRYVLYNELQGGSG